MPYSLAAYAMAIAAEIYRLHDIVRKLRRSLVDCQSVLDDDQKVRLHKLYREYKQGDMQAIDSNESCIQRRSMQMISLVSPFPWPIQVEPHNGRTWEGTCDRVLVEWDRYMRGSR